MEQINFYRMRGIIWCIRKLESRIEQERDNAVHTTSYMSRMPKDRRNYSRVEECVVKVIDMERACETLQKELEIMRDILIPMIDCLSDKKERSLMYFRYVWGLDPKVISKNTGIPVGFVYHILTAAENRIIEENPKKVS